MDLPANKNIPPNIRKNGPVTANSFCFWHGQWNPVAWAKECPKKKTQDHGECEGFVKSFDMGWYFILVLNLLPLKVIIFITFSVWKYETAKEEQKHFSLYTFMYLYIPQVPKITGCHFKVKKVVLLYHSKEPF